jgi:hypothetical protein
MPDLTLFEQTGRLAAEALMREKDRDGRLFFGSFPIGPYSPWSPPGLFKRLLLWIGCGIPKWLT